MFLDQVRAIVREELTAALRNREAGLENTELLKIPEAARRLNQSQAWLYRHWQEVGGKKLGPKSIRFAPRDLEKWLASKRGS